MLQIKKYLRNNFPSMVGLRQYWRHVKTEYINPRNYKRYGYIGKTVTIETPVFFTNQENVYLGDNTRVRRGFLLINNTGKFILKKYSVIATYCTVVTGNHTKNVTVPHTIAGAYHINDKETDVVVGEDVWIGVNCTLLPGTIIGRGAVIGACSMVNKSIPPYAVAVGSPAKIIASSFTIDEIIEHEKSLYPENERFSRKELEVIFEENFKGKKSIGHTIDISTSEYVNKIKRDLGIQINN